MKRALGAVLLCALLAGCSSAPEAAEPDARQTAPAAAIDRNFPDPDILKVGDTFYAYATNDNNANVQVAVSDGGDEWRMLDDDAFPDLPSWVIPGKTWAPEVTEVSPGNYVLYFTATNFRPSLQCIGVATSTNPAGPFVAVGDGMLVCPEEEGGAIDASTFVDGTGLHLVWKNDGNCCGLDTWISTAPLSADGLALTGPGQRIIKQTLAFEGELVEAPTIVMRDSAYVLLYSANNYGDGTYAVGLAAAPDLAGPWSKLEAPLLATESSGGRFRGPGGQDIVETSDDGGFLVVHSWDAAYTYRAMHVVPFTWDGAVPRLAL
ncbi:MAG: glycoside hydrolase family 43 protein [Microbacteriaceae bacterium]|nr:glycoside hydrolase family 43 protein [Microbacteriaceae bacterium]